MFGIGGYAGEREKGEEFFEIVRHAGRNLEHQTAGGKENGSGGDFSAVEENLTAKSAENAKQKGEIKNGLEQEDKDRTEKYL